MNSRNCKARKRALIDRLFRRLFGKAGDSGQPRVRQGHGRGLQYGTLESRQAMATIPIGGILDGSIGPAGRDIHQFQAAANSNIEIVLQSTAIQSGFVAKAVVKAPSGATLGTFFSGTTNNIFSNLQEGGTYTVWITDNNMVETGNYSIGIESTKPHSPNPSALPKGLIVSASISRNLEKDQWTFQGNKFDKLELAFTSRATQSGYVTMARLFAPSGALVTTLFSSGSPMDSQLTLEETGTYTLQISDNNYTETGSYTIGLEGISPISPGNIVLPLGSVLSGSINSALDKVQYPLDVPAQGTYEVAITGSAIDSGYVTRAKLFNSSGGFVTELFSSTTSGVSRRLTLSPGRYLLQISDNNLLERGNYRVGLEGISPISANPVTLVRGAVTSGTIDSPIDKKQYVFPGTAGQVIDLAISKTAGQSSFTAMAELFAQDGTSLFTLYSNSSSSSWRQRFTLPANGNYMLQVSDNNLFDTGAFKISLEGINPFSPDAITPAANTTLNRSITDTMQRDQFIINRSTGQSFTIDLRKASGGAAFLPTFQVIAPNGNTLGTFSSGIPRTFSNTLNGKYLILVFDQSFDSVGGYSFRWS